MTFTADIKDCESIPRSPEWYAKEPFDPSIAAFRNNSGKISYFMRSALDETYVEEPGDDYLAGTIPPEEREVRDTLLVTILLRNQVSRFAFWWSQFVRPTGAYLASLESFEKLSALCARSREHRAAFCRLANSEGVTPALRRELKRIIDVCSNEKRN